MEKRDLLTLRNSTVVTIGKNAENKELQLFFESTGCRYFYRSLQDIDNCEKEFPENHQ